MTTAFKDLKNVLNFVPRPIQQQLKDTEQMLSWALQVLRKVVTQERFVRDLAMLEIENHRACLPKGLKKITSITMMAEEAITATNAYNQYLDEGTESVLWQGEESEQSNSEIAATLFFQLFLDSVNNSEKWKPMKFIGHTKDKDFFTKDCWSFMNNEVCNDCYNEFSITPDGCLLTDEKTGVICINYISEMTDDKGNFLVPEEPVELWQAMGHYITAKFYEEEVASGKPELNRLYEQYMSSFGHYLREAKAIFRQKAFSYRLHYDLIHGESQLMRIPATWKNK